MPSLVPTRKQPAGESQPVTAKKGKVKGPRQTPATLGFHMVAVIGPTGKRRMVKRSI